MKYWGHYTIGSALLVILGFALANPLVFGICNRIYTFNNQVGCLDSSIGAIGEPLLILSVATLAVLLLLRFARQSVQNYWVNFAIWWLPLSVLLIAVTPVTNSNWMPTFSIERITVTIIMAALFTIISLGIIGWKQFGSKRK